MLSNLIDRAIAETAWNLSRYTKKHLPQLRDLGQRSGGGARRFPGYLTFARQFLQSFTFINALERGLGGGRSIH